MANAFVQVAPDSSGKKMQTFENTIGANLVEAEAVTLVRSSDNTEVGSSGQPLRVDPVGTTVQPVSGTITANQGTSPWVENVSQFGGSAVITGTGVSGAGIPRVTVSNDSAVVQGTPAANTAGWPITSGALAESTAAWTSATSGSTALQINTAGYAAIVVTLSITGSITGGVVTFEASDTTAFTNAYSIGGVRSFQGINSGTVAGTQALSGLANTAYVFNVSGFAAFRVRLSTVITNTGTLNVGVTASAMPNMLSAVVRADGSLVNVMSSLGASAPADNLASNTIFASSTTSAFPLSVADAVYGGAFSGTPNAALQGWSKLRTPTVFKEIKAQAVTAGTPVSIWTPGSGNKFRFMGAAVSSTVAASILFEDATGVEFLRTPLLAAAGIFTFPSIGNGYLSSAANNQLFIDMTLSGAVSGFVFGTEE